MSHEALKPKHGITPLQIETSTVATTPMKSLGEASNFNQGTWHLHSKKKMMLRVSSIPACKQGSSPPALVCPSRKPMQPWWMESLRQSRGVVISAAMTCCTTQNAAWSMSQSILSIVLFLVMFWTWRDNKQMQFFRRFFPAPRKGKQILRWHVRMHGDSGSGRRATCLNSARQTWHAPISKCQATTVSWGPQFTKLALSFHPASFKKYQHQVKQLKIKQVQLWIPWIPANQNRSPWIVVWEFLSYTTLLAHASFRRLINEIHGWWTKSWLMTQFHSLTFGH